MGNDSWDSALNLYLPQIKLSVTCGLHNIPYHRLCSSKLAAGNRFYRILITSKNLYLCTGSKIPRNINNELSYNHLSNIKYTINFKSK